MKKTLMLLLFLLSFPVIFAELKTPYTVPEKLTAQEMLDAPELYDSSIFPIWGYACMQFTYKVFYSDKQGRQPEYVRINLNGEWHDMIKGEGDYERGVLYTYDYVPLSYDSNYYYFEASNGAGKARAGIIDTPNQGPLVYAENFDNNEIVLLNANGSKVWNYSIGKDMVEGVSISDNNLIAIVTNYYIYLFSPENNTPLWVYCKTCKIPDFVEGTFAGIEVSDNGEYVAAALMDDLYYFSADNNTPLWTVPLEARVIGLDISENGSLIALGTANSGDKGDKIFLYNNKGEKLMEYRAVHEGYTQSGNFYHPDMTPDGGYIAASTGCPDRRAYLFSSNGTLIFRSEGLTLDSPIHKSSISDNAEIIAYSLDNMQGKELLILFDKNGSQLWSFSGEDGSARGVSVSDNGEYVAIGTTKGHIYLFSAGSNNTLWNFFESVYTHFAEVKLSPDGILLAAGSDSKKIYLFSNENNTPLWVYNTTAWVNKLDFNGEYVVAGTGLKEYFAEGMNEPLGNFECDEIIILLQNAVCGDNICEPAVENYSNCPIDCCGDYCNNNNNNNIAQIIINFFRKIIEALSRAQN